MSATLSGSHIFELASACRADDPAWLAVQRALKLSAELLFGSGKGDRLHGTEVT